MEGMALYLAKRIEIRKLNYTQVVTKFPDLKSDIDEILIADGFGNLIV